MAECRIADLQDGRQLASECNDSTVEDRRLWWRRVLVHDAVRQVWSGNLLDAEKSPKQIAAVLGLPEKTLCYKSSPVSASFVPSFWLDTVKSTRVVARPTSLGHQLRFISYPHGPPNRDQAQSCLSNTCQKTLRPGIWLLRLRAARLPMNSGLVEIRWRSDSPPVARR